MSYPNILSPQLCLGTAAFGMDYGITNTSGQVSSSLVRGMISYAIKSDINYFDTALSYGDSSRRVGESAIVYPDMKIISKFPSQQSRYFDSENISEWDLTFENMLNTLKVKSLDTLLLHDALDASKLGANVLFWWLNTLKERNLVKRIGLSIYSLTCLSNVDLNQIDVVQLPVSLYDQRLLNNGTIENLLSKGIKLHGRSLYLQGLLLQPSERWPLWIPQNIRAHHRRLQEYLEINQSSFIEIALNFARSLHFLELVIFGACNLNQLSDLLKMWRKPVRFTEDELHKWSLNDNSFLDPRKWPK